MPRKSSNLDKKMLRAGIAMLKKNGASKLSVREIAAKAGANLGMFNYHFGTKQNFILQALNQIYLSFIKDLSKTPNEDGDLENVLFQIAKFSRDHREMLTMLLSDVLSNDRVVTVFFRKHFSAHFDVLTTALELHLRQKCLRVENTHHSLRFLIGAVGVPNILLAVYNRDARKRVRTETDAELRTRAQAAIAGLEMAFCKKIGNRLARK